MPIEIREIDIRLSISGEDRGEPVEAPASGDTVRGALLTPMERASIVQECVEAALAALRAEAER